MKNGSGWKRSDNSTDRTGKSVKTETTVRSSLNYYIYIEVLKSPPPSGRGLFHFSSNKTISFRLLKKYSNNSLLSAPSLLVYSGKPSNNLLRNGAVGGVCLTQISAGRLASVHLRQSIFPSSGFNSVATDKGKMQSLPLTEYAWLILLNSLQSFPLLGLLE